MTEQTNAGETPAPQDNPQLPVRPEPEATPPKQPTTPEKATKSRDEHIARLNQENMERRQENTKLQDALTALQTSVDSRVSAIETELNKERDARKQAEFKTAQLEAATKAGLPPKLADRLKGTTPEELLADAQALAETLPKPQQQRVPVGYSGVTAPPTDAKRLYERSQGRGGSGFTPELNEALRGGVVSSD